MILPVSLCSPPINIRDHRPCQSGFGCLENVQNDQLPISKDTVCSWRSAVRDATLITPPTSSNVIFRLEIREYRSELGFELRSKDLLTRSLRLEKKSYLFRKTDKKFCFQKTKISIQKCLFFRKKSFFA